MRKKLALVLYMTFFSQWVHAETWTLRAAQEKLLQGNPDLRIQKNEREKSEAQLSEVRSAFWPSLDASASYQAFSKAQEINIPVGSPIGTINKPLGDKDREEYGLDLSYPLSLGGTKRQQVRAKRSSLEAQGERLHALENQLSLRLASLFYAWQAADTSRRTQEMLVGYYREYASHIASLVKNGAALPSKEAAAKAKLLGAQVDLQAAVDMRDSIGRAAALLIGLPPDSSISFVGEMGGRPFTATAPNLQHSELAFLEQTSTSLTYQEKAVFGQNFPTVVGMLGYRVANPGLNLGSNSYMNYGLIGVQMRWNLFSGFGNEAQRAQIRSQREEIGIERERQSAFFEEARVAAEKWQARLQQSREAAQAALEASRMALTETEAQHQHGTASDLDLLDARVQQAKAALQVQQVSLQQNIALWQWRYARGENLKFEGD